MIRKSIFKKMIDLNIEIKVFIIKIIDLNIKIKILAIKIILDLIF